MQVTCSVLLGGSKSDMTGLSTREWLVTPKRGGGRALAVERVGVGDSITEELSAECATVHLAGGGLWKGLATTGPVAPGCVVLHPAGCTRSFANTGSCPSSHVVAYGDVGEHAIPEPRLLEPAYVDSDRRLDSAGGFIDMGVHWLVTCDILGSRGIVVGTSTFEPDGRHDLHRHSRADEFFLIVEGRGRHVTREGSVSMGPGDMVLVDSGEWHGFVTDPGVTTRTIFGYFGVCSLEQAGYELLEDVADRRSP